MIKINRIFVLLLLLVSIPAFAFTPDGGVESLRQSSRAFAEVANRTSPSVVFIQVEEQAAGPAAQGQPMPFGGDSPFGDDFLRRFFGDQFPGFQGPQGQVPNQQRHAVGQGSGFIFTSENGGSKGKTYILTNNHVVENAEKITVRLQDGREFEAKVTGTDPKSDVAVIEIKVGGLKPLPLGDSSKIDVGEWVMAIGNPFGLSHTITVGVISAKGRTGLGINDYEDFIQTDAAINPGNSGGPLVNLDGEAIGMNTAIFTRSGGYMGLGFAIPINLAKQIANQLIDHGEVTRGYLGIVIQQMTPELAESFGIKQNQGILVSQVSEDSPAAQAGLKQGDVIVEYQGKAVKKIGDFRNHVALTAPGTKAELTVIRDGKRKVLTVKIGKLDGQKLAQNDGGETTSDELGLAVQTLTPQLADELGIKQGQGVVVTEVKPGSIAAMGGIKPGLVIVEVDRQPVHNASEFRELAKKSGKDKRILLLVKDKDAQHYVVLNW
ncbi:MAG: DegQ family serine endoprotease [Thiotrichales bacterium]